MKKYVKAETSDKKWTDYLPSDVRQRLANCRSSRRDIEFLTQAKWNVLKTKGPEYTPEDALVEVLDLLDANGQFIDLTKAEYDGIIERTI